MPRLFRNPYAIAPLLFLALFALFGCSRADTPSGQRADRVQALPPAEAEASLSKWLGGIHTTTLPVRSSGPAVATEAAGSVVLPPIETFPLAVDGGRDAAEIFASVDKSGNGPDGWMSEVAKRFNDARVRSQLRGLADGHDAPLKLVIASRSPLSHLFPDSPELDSPLAGICHQLDIPPFSPDVARAFLEHRIRDPRLLFAENEIVMLLAETGGHPAKLQRAAADLHRRYTSRG